MIAKLGTRQFLKSFPVSCRSLPGQHSAAAFLRFTARTASRISARISLPYAIAAKPCYLRRLRPKKSRNQTCAQGCDWIGSAHDASARSSHGLFHMPKCAKFAVFWTLCFFKIHISLPYNGFESVIRTSSRDYLHLRKSSAEVSKMAESRGKQHRRHWRIFIEQLSPPPAACTFYSHAVSPFGKKST
jgi:hypothetical protein